MKVNGKVAIVTGGCQGIGKGIVYALLKRGAKVAVLDINDTKGTALDETLKREFGEGRTVYRHCDVADKKQLEDVFESVKRRFSRVNIVVNNAGIAVAGGFHNVERCLDINLKAVIQGTMLGIDMMDKKSGNDGGVIVNMSSLSGIIPLSLDPVYTATKAGVIAFTRCFKAAASTNGVRVNCICPVFVAGTDMIRQAYAASSVFQDIVEKVKPITIDMVADAVIQTIEDETFAGKVVIVSKDHGIQKYNFPIAKI